MSWTGFSCDLTTTALDNELFQQLLFFLADGIADGIYLPTRGNK